MHFILILLLNIRELIILIYYNIKVHVTIFCQIYFYVYLVFYIIRNLRKQ